MEHSFSMGSSCSSLQGSQASNRQQGIAAEPACNPGSPKRKLLKFSLAESLPNKTIPSLYPVRDNYVLVNLGTDNPSPIHIRSPKSLAELSTESLCRNLHLLDGSLPRGLPEEVVEDIINSLYDHSALNAATLRALRNCELKDLSLAGCRGVTDDWLAAIGYENGAEVETKGRNWYKIPQQDETPFASVSSFYSADQEMKDFGVEPETGGGENTTSMAYFQLEGQYSLAQATPAMAETLTSLSLSGCQFVTDDGLLRLGDLYSLQTADFSGCQSVFGKGLLVLSESYDLTSLSVANCRRLGDEGVILISHLTSLMSLDLSGCRCISDQSLAAVAFLYNVRSLNLNVCDQITDHGLDKLQTLEKLNELRLGWCRLLSNAGLDRFAQHPGRASSLRVLQLSRLAITDEFLPSLALLISLEELDINGCVQISSSAFGSTLSQLPLLTKLDVSHCPGILRSSWQGKIDRLCSLDLTYANVKDAHMIRFTNLSSLEELRLGCCAVGDSSIAHLAGNYVTPNLRILDLSDTNVSDRSMAHIPSFTKLEQLFLFSCSLTNQSLRHVGKLSELRSLDIDCRDVTDDGLLHLRELKKLRKLILFSGRFTDAGCYHISNLASLEYLDLCGGAITDIGCCRLASRLANLRNLNLSQNERITNRGAAALATLQNLETLNLSNTHVDSHGLKVFSDLRNLKSLTLYGCRIISPRHILGLQNCLPLLRCLRVDAVDRKDGLVESDSESILEDDDDDDSIDLSDFG